MKRILVIAFLLLLLWLTACGTVQATSNTNDLETRITKLEQRVKELEDEVGIKYTDYSNRINIPSRIDNAEDELDELTRIRIFP